MNFNKDEGMVGFGSLEVQQMKKWAEEIASRWNGDTPSGEEKALCAKEIAEKCEELEVLLTEMSEHI